MVQNFKSLSQATGVSQPSQTFHNPLAILKCLTEINPQGPSGPKAKLLCSRNVTLYYCEFKSQNGLSSNWTFS